MFSSVWNSEGASAVVAPAMFIYSYWYELFFYCPWVDTTDMLCMISSCDSCSYSSCKHRTRWFQRPRTRVIPMDILKSSFYPIISMRKLIAFWTFLLVVVVWTVDTVSHRLKREKKVVVSTPRFTFWMSEEMKEYREQEKLRVKIQQRQKYLSSSIPWKK